MNPRSLSISASGIRTCHKLSAGGSPYRRRTRFSSNSSESTCRYASLYRPCVFSSARGPNEQPADRTTARTTNTLARLEALSRVSAGPRPGSSPTPNHIPHRPSKGWEKSECSVYPQGIGRARHGLGLSGRSTVQLRSRRGIGGSGWSSPHGTDNTPERSVSEDQRRTGSRLGPGILHESGDLVQSGARIFRKTLTVNPP